ncbi:hypothetical protein GCM10022221_49420 [Actinocorallia aurea]
MVRDGLAVWGEVFTALIRAILSDPTWGDSLPHIVRDREPVRLDLRHRGVRGEGVPRSVGGSCVAGRAQSSRAS